MAQYGSRPNRELMGADWDLCTTLVKFGQCSREDCKWRHENAEWWEGAWWQLDDEGRSWGWWQSIPSTEECPVSLTPICLLPEAPFELRSSGRSLAKGARPASRAESPRHRFDAHALAKYLVGSGQFMDPVNRRPLERDECAALDRATRGQYKVAEAFAAVQEVQAAGGGRTAATREVAVAARQLFVMPSAASEGQSAGARASNPRDPGGTAQRGKPAQQRPQVGHRDALVVHSEGGLCVVDDGQGQEDGVAEGHAPTPAEALAASAALAARPKRAPRPQRELRPGAAAAAGGRPQGDCCGGAQREAERAPAASKAPPREVAEEEPSSSSSSAPAQAWAPEWATPELQASQLAELERLLAEDSLRVSDADTGALDALREAQARRELLREMPVLCEVSLGGDLSMRLAVPPYYPMQPVTIVQASESATGSSRLPAGALRALEREARAEALRLEEERVPSSLSVLVYWLSTEALQRLPTLAAEARASEKRERAEAAEAARRAARAAQDDEETDASRARLAEKYSPSWDLCTAFVKHGKCKNKNCKWRHEKAPDRPAKDEIPEAAAGSQPKAAKGGKSKK